MTDHEFYDCYKYKCHIYLSFLTQVLHKFTFPHRTQPRFSFTSHMLVLHPLRSSLTSQANEHLYLHNNYITPLQKYHTTTRVRTHQPTTYQSWPVGLHLIFTRSIRSFTTITQEITIVIPSSTQSSWSLRLIDDEAYSKLSLTIAHNLDQMLPLRTFQSILNVQL